MAIVYVHGRMYYTRSIRIGDWVTSYSCGPALSEYARLMMATDLLLREGRRAERMRRQQQHRERAEARRGRRAFRDRLQALDRDVAAYSRRVTGDVEALMAARGFYLCKRERWRRRRNPMGDEPAGIDVRELARRAEQGDRAALGELAYHAGRVLSPLDVSAGELARAVIEPMLIAMIAGEYDPLRDAVAAKLAALRRDLAPRGSSAAEHLLAERAALNWLHAMILERDRVELLQSFEAGQDVDHRKIATVDQCLSRAQSRLERALTALARIRRLNLPVVINQVNVGGRVNGVRLTRE